jgi:hypothetical protein
VDNAETSDLILGNFEIGVVAKSPVPMPSGENKYSVCVANAVLRQNAPAEFIALDFFNLVSWAVRKVLPGQFSGPRRLDVSGKNYSIMP